MFSGLDSWGGASDGLGNGGRLQRLFGRIYPGHLCRIPRPSSDACPVSPGEKACGASSRRLGPGISRRILGLRARQHANPRGWRRWLRVSFGFLAGRNRLCCRRTGICHPRGICPSGPARKPRIGVLASPSRALPASPPPHVETQLRHPCRLLGPGFRHVPKNGVESAAQAARFSAEELFSNQVVLIYLGRRHKRTVLSQPPETASLPSGEKATQPTRSVWPK